MKASHLDGRDDLRPAGADGRVLHYRSPFLAESETFIRTLIAAHVRYEPEILTHEQRGAPGIRDHDHTHVFPPSPGWVATLARRWLVSRGIAERRRAVKSALAAVRPDVLHAHFAEEGIAAWPPARRAKVPLIVTFYGYDATELPRHLAWRLRIRRLFQGATLVLAEGPHLRGRLEALGCPPGRLRVQPIAIQLERFPYREPRPGPEAVILQACRFVPKKGVDLTLRALARADRRTSARLRLIGDGPERARLEALAAELGIADRIQFLGMRTHEEYARELATADIFIQPSRYAASGDGEGGAPTTLLEAQAVGLPVVATTHADIPFVTHPEAARLAPEEDVRALAGHLDHLLAHPEEWPGRARIGRRHVEEQHDAKVLVDRLEDIYDEARRIVSGGGES
ncbi:MAG TPA: glycosyltransferase [Longimicrobiales bacterium]|nr:glycosyltransferase [Longimicrobiales bacterium]